MQRRKMEQRMFSRRRLLLRVFAFGLAGSLRGLLYPVCRGATHERGRYWYCHRYERRRCNPRRPGPCSPTLEPILSLPRRPTAPGITRSICLNPGQYTVTIEARGFKKLVIPGFALAARDRLRENADMEAGSVEETVQVSAAAPPPADRQFYRAEHRYRAVGAGPAPQWTKFYQPCAGATGRECGLA